MPRMVSLRATQKNEAPTIAFVWTITPSSARMSLTTGRKPSEPRRAAHELEALWLNEGDSWPVHVDRGSAVRVCRGKGRCRIGLERNCRQHSDSQRSESIRPGAIWRDCAARCL